MQDVQIDPGVQCQMHEQWLAGEQGTIRYWLSEERPGIPVVLIHGYGALIEHWRRVLPLLREQHTVCAFDLYNFGYSAQSRETPGKEIWVAQAAQVIREVVDQPAVVIGHSMGGMVAAQLAADHPELVRGMVLVNSVGLRPERDPSAFERVLFGAVRTPWLGELLSGVMTGSWAVRQSLLSAYYDKENVTPELVEAFSGPLRKPDGPQGYLAVSRAFQNLVLDIEPGTVQTPALVVWGEQDRSMPSTLAERFQRELFPQATVEIIAETAHCPFDERPAAFAELVLPWIADLEGVM